MSDQPKLNPAIKELEIGVEELVTIKVFPLSLGDQLKMTELIRRLVDEYLVRRSEFSGMSDAQFIQDAVEIIRDNLKEALKYIVKEDPQEVVDSITNVQFMQLAKIVYEVNFEPLKNAVSLFRIAMPKEEAVTPPVMGEPLGTETI